MELADRERWLERLRECKWNIEREAHQEAEENLDRSNIVEEDKEEEGIETAVADNGYLNEDTIRGIDEEKELEMLVATAKGAKLRKKFRDENQKVPEPAPDEMIFRS